MTGHATITDGARLAHAALGGIVLAVYTSSRLPGIPGDPDPRKVLRSLAGQIDASACCQVATVAS